MGTDSGETCPQTSKSKYEKRICLNSRQTRTVRRLNFELSNFGIAECYLYGPSVRLVRRMVRMAGVCALRKFANCFETDLKFQTIMTFCQKLGKQSFNISMKNNKFKLPRAEEFLPPSFLFGWQFGGRNRRIAKTAIVDCRMAKTPSPASGAGTTYSIAPLQNLTPNKIMIQN